MAVFEGLLAKLAGKSDKTVQGANVEQAQRDYLQKGESYSVETDICEALANLMLLSSSFPIEGDSERARFLDATSDAFMRTVAAKAVITGFLTGDCLVVPSWNGRNIQNLVVPSGAFSIYEANGDEVTACGYVLDSRKRSGMEYQLVQSVELVPYEDGGGFENVYRTFVARNGSLATGMRLSDFPDWEAAYTPEWRIPNVERLLVGRFKSLAYDPVRPNNPKGVPITFGAGEHVREIRYLLDQMHSEFGLSEKMVMASKNLLEKNMKTGDIELPRGKRRLFVKTNAANVEDQRVTEWAPDIRYEAYLEAIDKQMQMVELAVGVSGGIISKPNDMNYQNVDNVRKSQQKTIGFIDNARKQAEQMLSQLAYSWDVIANYYGVNPMGKWQASFDWSDDYIETFSDKMNAIIAGEPMGATGPVDYRMWLYGESPEVARERVAEYSAGRGGELEAAL